MMEKETVTLDIKAPRSINPDISVDVDISINGAVFIPFTAMPDDTTGHDIYVRALKGEFGKITLSPGPDYLWSGRKWIANQMTDSVNEAELIKQQRLAEASAAIAPLQDAVDLAMATDAEVAMLQGWKTYRVLLNRVDTSKPVWPEVPRVA